MAAGLGFKDFVTGEVLTAADVDGYLMQGVWVFASAAARDAAVTSPQEGNFAYLKDTNVTTYYTGSAWANLDTTGMTNPMTTTGDTIYSSSGSTPARLGIGSTGNVLTVAGGVPTWAAPAGGGGMTLLSTTTLSGASTQITLSGGYKQYHIVAFGLSNGTAGTVKFQCNATTNVIDFTNSVFVSGSPYTAGGVDTDYNFIGGGGDTLQTGNTTNSFTVNIYNPDSTTANKNFESVSGYYDNSNRRGTNQGGGLIKTTSALTSITFLSGTSFSAGTVLTYGVN
jgi:hypothetical protein